MISDNNSAYHSKNTDRLKVVLITEHEFHELLLNTSPLKPQTIKIPKLKLNINYGKTKLSGVEGGNAHCP